MNNNQSSAKVRPLRSCLYVPGANKRAMEKASILPADAVIFDLEDAVLPEAKVDARQAVCDMAMQNNLSPKAMIIRINDLHSPWGMDDLLAVAQTQVDAILIPKIQNADDIYNVDRALKKAGAAPSMAIWAMIEMPMAFLNLREIAATSQGTALSAFVMGINDLAKELNAQQRAGRAAFTGALQQSIMTARAYGLNIIDGVFNDISNDAGLISECQQGRDYGFDGKTIIHPAQLQICNDIFAPNREEIKQAEDIIAAFADPANAGKGVVKVNGKMAEILHLEQAKLLLLKFQAIENMKS